MSKEIGARIRRIREEQNFNQAGMAADLGVTPGAYAKIERGETDANISRLYQIADVLNVPIIYLLEDQPLTDAVNIEVSKWKIEIDELSQSVADLQKELKKTSTKLTALTKHIASQKTPKKK
jgi:transcriptional regulator with XRE-family HTH domain